MSQVKRRVTAPPPARRVRPVGLPDGTTAHVRALTLNELRAFRSRMAADRKRAEAVAAADGAGLDEFDFSLIALAHGVATFAARPDGTPRFDPADVEAALDRVPADEAAAIAEAGLALNGFGEAVERGKAGSPETTSSGGSCDSPASSAAPSPPSAS
jgi:hypothetical protein